MKQLKFNISGEINNRIYDELARTIISHNDFKEIVLIINSGGGSVDIGFGMYDLLKSLNKKITTIAIGKCYSIATILFALGEKRYIGKNSNYMLHQTSRFSGQDESFKSGDFRDMIQTADYNEKKWKAIINQSCNKDISDFLDNIFSSTKDKFLTVEETLDFGIATEKLENLKDILSWE